MSNDCNNLTNLTYPFKCSNGDIAENNNNLDKNYRYLCLPTDKIKNKVIKIINNKDINNITEFNKSRLYTSKLTKNLKNVYWFYNDEYNEIDKYYNECQNSYLPILNIIYIIQLILFCILYYFRYKDTDYTDFAKYYCDYAHEDIRNFNFFFFSIPFLIGLIFLIYKYYKKKENLINSHLKEIKIYLVLNIIIPITGLATYILGCRN